MSELKEVIYNLERCICHVPDACRDCSKFKDKKGLSCMEELMADALELLKKYEKCGVVFKNPDCEHAEHDGAGCLGYAGCWQDDEPIDVCKTCTEYTGNITGDSNQDDRL